MATVFALEQKSCIRSLAIKDHCQAREWGLPVTKSHQQYCKELLMLNFGANKEFGQAAKKDFFFFFLRCCSGSLLIYRAFFCFWLLFY